MKVKELIAELGKYDPELDVVFCDSSYDDPNDTLEVCADKYVSKEVVLYEGVHDTEAQRVFPSCDLDESMTNCLAMSIQGLFLKD